MSAATDNPITTMRAADVMPGDCCRINGCWETVFMVGGGVSGDSVELYTESGKHDMHPSAAVETAGDTY